MRTTPPRNLLPGVANEIGQLGCGYLIDSVGPATDHWLQQAIDLIVAGLEAMLDRQPKHLLPD